MKNPAQDALLGIDLGTGGCKITLLDARGRILAGGFEEYPTAHPQPGWAEQDPADWRAAVAGILQGLRARGAWDSVRIRALAVTGSTHNAVLLDAHLEPVRPVIMWTDQRSGAECADLERMAGDSIFAATHHCPAPTWTLPQLLWLKRHEPEVLGRAAHLVFVKDYLRLLLTGELATDHIDAQGSLLYDVRARRWSGELCSLAGIPPAWLPPLADPPAVVGRVTAAAAREMGLPEGVPVVAGASDSAVEDYAAGAVEPGQCVVKLATAGNVNVMTAAPAPHRLTLTYSHVVPGLWYTVSATNAAAVCLRWFRDAFLDGAPAGPRDSLYAVLDREAAGSPPGARGLFFHPYLQGERSPYWDPALRASFTGAALSHRRGDFARAVMEGVGFSLLDCRRVIDGLGLPIDSLRLIGGGAKSALWSQIICDMFGRPLARPESCDAAFGAALLAGVGAGVFADERDAAARCVRLRDTLEPDPGRRDRYAALFPTYRDIQRALAPVYAGLVQP